MIVINNLKHFLGSKMIVLFISVKMLIVVFSFIEVCWPMQYNADGFTPGLVAASLRKTTNCTPLMLAS